MHVRAHVAACMCMHMVVQCAYGCIHCSMHMLQHAYACIWCSIYVHMTQLSMHTRHATNAYICMLQHMYTHACCDICLHMHTQKWLHVQSKCMHMHAATHIRVHTQKTNAYIYLHMRTHRVAPAVRAIGAHRPGATRRARLLARCRAPCKCHRCASAQTQKCYCSARRGLTVHRR